MTEKININNFSEKLEEFNNFCSEINEKLEKNEEQINRIKIFIEKSTNDFDLLNYLNNRVENIEKNINDIYDRINFRNTKKDFNNEKLEKDREELYDLHYEHESILKELETFNRNSLIQKIEYFRGLLVNAENERKNLFESAKKINKIAKDIDNYTNSLESKIIFEGAQISPENIDNISEYFYLNTAAGIANPNFLTKLLRTASKKFDEVLQNVSKRNHIQNPVAGQNTIELTEEEKEKVNFTKKCLLCTILIYSKNKMIQEGNKTRLSEINEFINKVYKFRSRKMENKVILYKEVSGNSNLIKISEDLKDDLKNELRNITKICDNLNKQFGEKYKLEEIIM